MTLVRSAEQFEIGGALANASGVRSPELGVKPDGTLFSVSTRNVFGEFSNIYVEYSSDGEVVLERVVPINDFPANESPDAFQMVAMTGGGFVVLYQFGVGSTREPFVQIFDDNGNPDGPPMEVPRSPDGVASDLSQDGYHLVADPSGGFSVLVGLDRNDPISYELQPNNLFSRGFDVRVVEYDQDGNITAGPYFSHATTGVPGDLAGNNAANSHDMFEDGRTIVAHYAYAYDTNSNGVLRSAPNVTVSILRDGQLLGETIVFQVNWINDFAQSTPNLPTAGGPGRAPSVTVLEGGGFAVAYQTTGPTGNLPWQVRFYDNTGSPTGTLVSTGMGDPNPEFAALPDGSLAMLATNAVAVPVDVRLLILNSNGVAEQFVVDSVNGFPRYDGLDVDPDGSIYVSLQDGSVVRYVQQNGSTVGDSADETLNGTAGRDTILGEGGDDTINGRNGNDKLEGGSGNDSISGASGSDKLLGGSGNDEINGGNGRDLANLGSGDDIYTDTAQSNSNGQDTVNGGTGNDRISGGGGNDVLNGGSDDDRVFGQNGRDTLSGDQGNDRLFGGNQNDTADGGTGNDFVAGGSGNDTLNGNAGRDQLFGGMNDDLLNGGRGNDSLFGGNGNDALNGNQGNDTLNGGNGNDLLNGGQGVDDFVFTGNFGRDTIQDFDASDRREDINLAGVNTITSFADLSSNHMSQVGTSVVITAGGGNTITLLNTTLASLDAGDFVF